MQHDFLICVYIFLGMDNFESLLAGAHVMVGFLSGIIFRDVQLV